MKFEVVIQGKKKYHMQGCKWLNPNVKQTTMPEDDAVKHGFKPCRTCRDIVPPKEDTVA